ncbi:MAG: hypothetical protein METHP_01657 [Methanoregula sp. SKADARSKE-2]|nr:MAG: hypothetical protein METHP_01657 [Methanoregula sp. SKADARSKE-2]
MRIEPASLSNEASLGKAPIFLVLRLSSLLTRSRSLVVLIFFQNSWRKGSAICQPMVEPMNRVSRPSESMFIELNSELLQSMGITQAFLQCLGNFLVIFSWYFPEDSTDEVYVTHLP